MAKKMKGLLRIIFGRTTFAVLALAVQIGVLAWCFLFFMENIVYVFGLYILLSTAVVLYILNKRGTPEYKTAWIIPVLILPVFGSLLYLFVELQLPTRLMAGRVKRLSEQTRPYLAQDPETERAYCEDDQADGGLPRYMNRWGGFPVYQNTSVTYFPLGDDKFPELLRQLEGARHFIFLEYFIVEQGVMWNSILEVLERKAEEGVEVRVMYDGMGCLTLLPRRYPEELREKGIRCKVFSPVRPVLSTYQNNRDHRKIAVIDGHTAFTGGVNLADEYINRKERFGHWKDTAVMVKGDGVKSFTMMFLQNWNITESGQENYEAYLEPHEDLCPAPAPKAGYVMPYGDSPLDEEAVGKQVYVDILYQAKRYVHMMTPYLILDQDMMSALTYAAKRGVETIIIMPHIPDKIYAYLLARSYYEELLMAGVKIYEYTPGFVHAKVYVSDDDRAVVGTINMDYRSLYLHFECAAYFCKNPAVEDVERDFQDTLEKCQEITLEDCRSYPAVRRFAGSLLRLFAPLM
ncbi:MAG TPA: cardiolipin synthase [Candidatus Lachnoclostridium pullistercoris]|uniref:Cardiolipin synthase n=1 Tax=Candidatus Lachnoclostridium pullistercoris TaxID=2838632 RepID=A0A9D2PFT6_9FIRM|nr:cardiolipin synthase [Candidatus Lachnoclostridium pullistercoris]